jgi:hypothetical protein
MDGVIREGGNVSRGFEKWDLMAGMERPHEKTGTGRRYEACPKWRLLDICHLFRFLLHLLHAALFVGRNKSS